MHIFYNVAALQMVRDSGEFTHEIFNEYNFIQFFYRQNHVP